jgi:hypothetical protein
VPGSSNPKVHLVGRVSKLLAAVAVAVCVVFPASASASVHSCLYRNLTHGQVPYIAQVATNLTPAAAGGAGVCEVVRAVVMQVQLRGYDPGSGSPFVDVGNRWTLSHHLVYPNGWPRPRGPVYDPHMHVTLRMTEQPQAQSRKKASARVAPFWIKLNEYT